MQYPLSSMSYYSAGGIKMKGYLAMSDIKKRLAAAVLAHVDSGKTTLSEAMLYCCGEIRSTGRVDHGSSFLDTNSVERERGITVFSKQAVIHRENTEITLLDTPGHADFSGETERALFAADIAVLVISGTDGIQSHTKALWQLLERYELPTFIFVNKMDMRSADRELRFDELSSKLGHCADFGEDIPRESFLEAVSLCDEDFMNEYIETADISRSSIVQAIAERKLFPCLFGSALKNEGVDVLISRIAEYAPFCGNKSEFGARVFKISADGGGNRLTHMKITGGSLKTRDIVTTVSAGETFEEKAAQLRVYSGAKYTAVSEAVCGMVCAVSGLKHTYVGQGLGTEADAPLPAIEPATVCGVTLPDGTDVRTALSALKVLGEEDPALHVSLDEQHGQIQLQCMGEIHREILSRTISERFGFAIGFGKSRPAYRETISAPVVGIGHFEPLRHYAEVHLLLEPMPRGSGLVFTADCKEEVLSGSFQRQIISALREKQHIGVLTGSPVTDIRVTVISGRAHPKHTDGGDFREAAWRAFRQGLRSAKCILLEPQCSFTLELPAECSGRAVSDIQLMNGDFSPPEIYGESAVIRGSAPVSAINGYQSILSSYTSGRGRLTCVAGGYKPCSDPDNAISAIGYDCDADAANTADSVFCSHGAGFIVRWNEVENYAHISPERNEASEDRHIAPPQSRSFEDDKELIAIFERTYGAIKRDRRSAMYTPKEPQENQKVKTVPIPAGPEHLFVDGYNMIFAWDELKAAANKSLDLARSQLINRLCSYQACRKCVLTVVFDGYRVKGNTGSVEYPHSISVVYTAEGETADSYIERAVYELAGKHRVRVASSDNLEQLIVTGTGAMRISAEQFHAELQAEEAALRKFIEKN